MKTKEYWNFLMTELTTELDENSPEFTSYLVKTGIEKETINITYYTTLSEAFLGILSNAKISHHYLFIDKIYYNKIYNILKGVNAENLVNDISSIIKKGYYKTILSKLNIARRNKRAQFAKEFNSLYEFIFKDVNSVTLDTSKQKERLKIKDSNLINLVKLAFLESLLLDREVAEYIVEYEITNKKRVSDLSEIYINTTALDLLFYIALKGVFKENDINNTFENKFTNKQYELAFFLMEAAGLIKPEEEFGSSIKDYMRSQIKRFIKKHLSENPDSLTYIKTGERTFTYSTDLTQTVINTNIDSFGQ